jgi:TRAP-type C4-dicarboxylate transport system permease small subunit
MNPWKKAAGAVDDAVFRVERWLLLGSVSMMTLLVTLDVTQRTFSRPEGRTTAILLALLRPQTDDGRRAVVELWSPLAFGLASLLFLVLAAHAARCIRAERSGGASPSTVRSALVGAGLWGVAALLVQGFLMLFPSSVPGAQKFALGFMLWAGMLGASLATRLRRHIVLDAVSKTLKGETARRYALAGGIATGLFCLALAWLGGLQLRDEVVEWASGDGVGVYDALPIPKWLGTLSVPFAFLVMGLRFVSMAVGEFVWGRPVGGVDAHGVDLEALAKADVGLEGGAS